MARMWVPKDNKTLKYYVDLILEEASDSLNDWENKFINDVSIIVYNGGQLSQRQEEILEKIYVEKTK